MLRANHIARIARDLKVTAPKMKSNSQSYNKESLMRHSVEKCYLNLGSLRDIYNLKKTIMYADVFRVKQVDISQFGKSHLSPHSHESGRRI